jgi:two-component system, NtrC family, sensor histidine kinase HydH
MKIFNVPEKPYGKPLYFPMVAIIAAVLTLIMLLVVFMYRNLTIGRQRLETAMIEEGLTLIRAIEAGNRTGMRMRWPQSHLQTLVEEIGNSPKIVYIAIIGTSGQILAHNQQQLIGEPSGLDMTYFSRSAVMPLIKHTRTAEGQEVFEITAAINTTSSAANGEAGPGAGRGMMRGMNTPGMSIEMGNIAAIQLGLRMTDLKHLQQNDLKNSIVMLAVLSVVGSAALYFIVVMQNYAAVNRAFLTMKSYTQHVVDSMANGLISLDTTGKIVTMNRQAHHILAIPIHESAEGKGLPDVMSLHDVDLASLLQQGTPVIEQDVRCTTLAHTTVPLSLSASILTDDTGNQLGTVLLFRDLSDVKALQEQVQRSERLAAVGRLAAGVAHEIRNPLGALKGFLQYFQRKLATLQEQDRTYFTVMVNEVDRLNTVIANLLEFARPKDPVREPCNLTELLRHVLTLFDSDLQAKQIAVTVDIPNDLPLIPLDRDQITQVVLNLVLNALQAMEPQGTLHLTAQELQEQNRVELTIADSGPGIVPEDLPKIFDPFFTTKKRGAGLGLAIAETIIQQHQGAIVVESEPGQGCTFQIRLPLK